MKRSGRRECVIEPSAVYIPLHAKRGEGAGECPGPLVAAAQPIVAKCLESWQGLAILDTIRGALAPDDVIRMADRKALDVDAPPPRALEVLDAVRREHEVGRRGRFSTVRSLSREGFRQPESPSK